MSCKNSKVIRLSAAEGRDKQRWRVLGRERENCEISLSVFFGKSEKWGVTQKMKNHRTFNKAQLPPKAKKLIKVRIPNTSGRVFEGV